MNLSRRKFLKIGAASAVALTLPSDEFVRKFWQGTDVSAANGRGARVTMSVIDEATTHTINSIFTDWAERMQRTDTPFLTIIGEQESQLRELERRYVTLDGQRYYMREQNPDSSLWQTEPWIAPPPGPNPIGRPAIWRTEAWSVGDTSVESDFTLVTPTGARSHYRLSNFGTDEE